MPGRLVLYRCGIITKAVETVQKRREGFEMYVSRLIIAYGGIITGLVAIIYMIVSTMICMNGIFVAKYARMYDLKFREMTSLAFVLDVTRPCHRERSEIQM